jgi:hypothetical protein
MRTHVYYLSTPENTLLNLKAEGFSTNYILENCPMPAVGYHIFTAEVKRKTNILGKEPSDYRAFLEDYKTAMSGNLTTPEQTRVIRQFIEGDTLTLNMSRDELQSALDAACKAAGIFTRDERCRKFAMRLYLAIFRFNGKPLDTLETKFLREMAQGKSFEEINEYCPAQQVQFVVRKAHDACVRLYFDAPGRNAQRNLLRAYFAYLDAQRPTHQDPMDDPAF